ncbi:hypothetical protein GGR54DRAFT_634076 [Hypoxylon sp. NC1633]|nr:hypothetical protein GGR54DRAFT_634076 [Hypoxylon sp. NC1633]
MDSFEAFHAWEPTVVRSPSGRDDIITDSNLRPIPSVENHSPLASAPLMAYSGGEYPHVLQKVGTVGVTSLNENVNRHSVPASWVSQEAYPGTDHAALTSPNRVKHPNSSRADGQEDLKIVPYRDPKMKTRREPGCRGAYRVDALIKDKNPRSEFKRDKNGMFQGSFRVFGANERIRSDFTDGSRSSSAVTRAFGACGRCQRQKLRCNMSKDLFMPCERCSKLPHRYLKTPCIRVSILSLNLHRRGSTLSNDLRNWTLAQEAFSRSHIIQNGGERLDAFRVVLTQDQGIEIPVTVKRFVPWPADTTGWRWQDGASQERVMEMPPFYIINEEEAARNMRRAVASKKEEYINCLLVAANPIIRKTFEAAFRYVEITHSRLVLDCLTFWVATRFIEKPWRICSDGLPGFEAPYELHCPFNGIIPVTPIMDTQIDDMAIKFLLNPLGKRILKDLNEKIHEKKRENWFEIYLATFIIMNNFEFVFSDVVDYTKRHGLKPSSTGASSLSKGYFHTCKTMLVYFRFACNGHAPLSLSWSGRPGTIDGLTFDQHEYIRDIKTEVDRQIESLEGWRRGSVYRTPLYLCYQVLAQDWSPDVPNSEPIDDFTEEDFLTS